MKYRIKLTGSLFLFSLLCLEAAAQELVSKTIRNQGWIETFQVLKSDKKIRQGTYELSHNGKQLVTGNFFQNAPSGRWMRVTGHDEPVLRYNFSLNRSEFHQPEREMLYEILAPTKEGDKVTLPASVLPLNFLFGRIYLDMFMEIRGETGDYTSKLEIVTDANNKPVSIVGSISKSGKQLIRKNIPIEGDLKWVFVSASLNGQAVSSKLTHETKLRGSVGITTQSNQRSSFPRN